MMKYISREFSKNRNGIIKSVIGIVAAMMVAVILCFVLKRFAEPIAEIMNKVPYDVYSLFGLSGRPNPESVRSWAEVLLLVGNIVIIVTACYRVCHVVERDEDDGTIFFYCNQLYTRREIILCKYIGSVVSYIIEYCTLIIVTTVTVCVADAGSVNVAEFIGAKVMLMFGGICIGILYISVLYVFCVYGGRKESLELNVMVFTLTYGLIIVGNLYKILRVVALLVERFSEKTANMLKGLKFLKELRVISPLSHINPSNNYGIITWLVVCGVSLALSAFFLKVTVYLYNRRNIEYESY